MIPSVCLFIPFLSEILWKYNDSSKSLQNKAGDWLYKTKKLAIPSEGATNKIVDIDTAKVLGPSYFSWGFAFEKEIFDSYLYQHASEHMKTAILKFTRSKKTSDGFFTLKNQLYGEYLAVESLNSDSSGWPTLYGKYIMHS